MPQDAEKRRHIEAVFEEVVREEGQTVLGWRDVPVDNEPAVQGAGDRGDRAGAPAGLHRPGAVACGDDEFERRLFILRKVVSNRVHVETEGRDIGFYVVSLSARTIVYKGMFLAYQLGAYYADLTDPRFESALALVHQRFSTNTFPSWKLAHPYRMVAHNGEINTLRGNVNWMAARQASVDSELFGNDISKLWPISYEGQSDTACFDNALEFLTEGGYPLSHAMMMLIPEAWAGNKQMPKDTQAFYEYHAALMEPWDGPAAVAFTDGRQIGATLDRNGLRPARYIVTDDDLVIMASEAGTLPVDEARIVKKWRLQPGRMLLIDLEKGGIVSDEEIKREMASANPYRRVAEEHPDHPGGPEAGGAARLALGRLAARSPAGLRLHAGGHAHADGADGHHRPGSDRLDGHRHADLGDVVEVEAALHLFQAELRPGHQPADRPDPRGTGDEPRLLHRAAAEHLRSRGLLAPQAAGGAPADPDQWRPGEDPQHRPHRGPVRHQDHRHDLCRRKPARRAWRVRWSGCASAPRRRSPAATTSSSCRTGRSARTASRSRRCSPARPCITT